MSLIKNKKYMILSGICAVITIVAICSISILISYIDISAVVKCMLIFFTIIIAIAGFWAASVLDLEAGYYECPHCGAHFTPSLWEYLRGIHTVTKRRLKCHTCGKTSMCRHIVVK